MSKEDDNKSVVGRWFTDFWGKTCNLEIVDELAAPDMLLQYSLHEPRRGREDIKAFMTGFREAFPDLNFWGAADLIAEGDYVVLQTHGQGRKTKLGNEYNNTYCIVYKIADGKVQEVTEYCDTELITSAFGKRQVA